MRLVAYTSPARGHLYPAVPILLELVKRGHRSMLCALAGEVSTVAALGIAATAISPRVEELELDDYRGRTGASRAMRALATFAARAEPEATDLVLAIERHRPDALLIDVNCWGAAAVAEASGLPWSMYSPYLLTRPSPEAPPFGLGLSPVGGPLGRMRDALLGTVAEALANRAVLPAVNRVRASSGIAPLGAFRELSERPPLLLALTVEDFDYPRSDWPANVRFVGSIDWAPPSDRPDWLSRMPDPLVLVTCSTERQRDESLLTTALRSLPSAGIGVLATSAAHDPDAFDAPPGSRVVRFMAHEHALDRVACVVCHGGMGITQKALGAGVPVVIVPFGRDQRETARRVELARAGVRLRPRELTQTGLAQAVRRAIGLRDGARRIGCLLARGGGAPAAAEAIERLVDEWGGAGAPRLPYAAPCR